MSDYLFEQEKFLYSQDLSNSKTSQSRTAGNGTFLYSQDLSNSKTESRRTPRGGGRFCTLKI